jgi:FKBP-type peptidyl-prolyl cis-trans isomerase 2
MAQAKEGDTVRVHYTGKLSDGSVFDSSWEREALEFTLGAGQLIPGFEEAVKGMAVEDTLTFEVASDDAYGPYREEMVLTVNRDEFPKNVEPQVGQHIQVNLQGGQELVVRVKDVTDDQVTLDANHPLAGQDLTFEIKLMEIL